MEATLQDVDVTDLIPEVAKEQAKKSSGVPVIAVPGIKETIKRLALKSRELTDLTAEVEMMKADVKAAGEPLRVEYCKRTGKLAASIHLEGLAMYTVQNKYAVVSEATAKELSGEQPLDVWFAKDKELKVDASKLTKEAILALVACGAAQYVTTFKPNTVFHTARSMDLDLAKKADSLGIKPQQTLKIS